MKKEPYLVTKDGLEEMKKELKERLEVKRPELRAVVDDAITKGDLSENDAYNLALEQNLSNEAEIARLEDAIFRAKVVEGKNDNKVNVGEKVELKDTSGTVKVLQIVGENQSDPINNKISHSSPLGKAIVGKKKGDKVEFQTPRGKQVYTIQNILN